MIIGADPAGHVRVTSGWQGDLPKGDGMHRPSTHRLRVGRRTTLAGPVHVRFVDVPTETTTLPSTGSIGRPTPRLRR